MWFGAQYVRGNHQLCNGTILNKFTDSFSAQRKDNCHGVNYRPREYASSDPDINVTVSLCFRLSSDLYIYKPHIIQKHEVYFVKIKLINLPSDSCFNILDNRRDTLDMQNKDLHVTVIRAWIISTVDINKHISKECKY